MAIFTNQATLAYSGGTTNSNITIGELVETLSATKTAVIDSYGMNDSVTYVISLVNSGATSFNGLTITDDLGGYAYNGNTIYPLNYIAGSVRYYVNGVLQPAPAVTGDAPVTISGISVPAGGNAIVLYEAQINGFAPMGTTDSIVNTATISGAGLSAPLTAEETITPNAAPFLTIAKSVSPTTIAENGQLTYTFLIQNFGNTAAVSTDDVVLSDTFDPVLSNLVATLNGTLLVAGTDYSYNETTGVFATTSGRIVVPAATYTRNPDTGEWIVTPGTATLVVTGIV